jgi:hypothetical protein
MIGALLLSILHASIPNHWIPLVVLSKAEKWNEKGTMGITAIAGFSHTLSTIIIGIIVGFLGYKLSDSYSFIVGVIAPSLLILLGIIYLILSIRANKHHLHPHDILNGDVKKKTTSAIILTLTISMFFSPCMEIEAYYFVAGKLGWEGIIAVSLIYSIITVAGMLLLVWLGMKGIRKIQSHLLEHHEKTITGILLVVLGIAGFFIR